MTPSIAVAIPSYNAADSIGKTLESLARQTLPVSVCHVYDNASTDGSLDVVAAARGLRIEVHPSAENRGWKYNFDRCVQTSGTDYIHFAHTGEVYSPRFLELNLAQHLARPELCLTFSRAVSEQVVTDNFADERAVSLAVYDKPSIARQLLLRGNFLFCPTAFGPTNTFNNLIESFNAAEYAGAADLDAWLRVLDAGPIGVIENPVLAKYHLKAGRLSHKDQQIQGDGVFVDLMRSLRQKDRLGLSDSFWSASLEMHALLHRLGQSGGHLPPGSLTSVLRFLAASPQLDPAKLKLLRSLAARFLRNS